MADLQMKACIDMGTRTLDEETIQDNIRNTFADAHQVEVDSIFE